MASAFRTGDVHSERLGLAQIQAQCLVSVLRAFQPTATRNISKRGCLRQRKCIRPHNAYVAFRTLKMRSSLRLDQPWIRCRFSYHA